MDYSINAFIYDSLFYYRVYNKKWRTVDFKVQVIGLF